MQEGKLPDLLRRLHLKARKTLNATLDHFQVHCHSKILRSNKHTHKDKSPTKANIGTNVHTWTNVHMKLQIKHPSIIHLKNFLVRLLYNSSSTYIQIQTFIACAYATLN